MTNPKHTDTSRSGDLKPCPFCGGSDLAVMELLSRGLRIECEGCGVYSPVTKDGPALLIAWNTRAEASSAEPVAGTVTLDRALLDISEPDMPGAFNGDTWFGHPEKRTLATHRWDGKKWQELPSELDACLRLLAKARDEAKEARTAYVALTQTLIDAERREKQSDLAGYERGQRETVARVVAWLTNGADDSSYMMRVDLIADAIDAGEWK